MDLRDVNAFKGIIMYEMKKSIMCGFKNNNQELKSVVLRLLKWRTSSMYASNQAVGFE